MWTPGGRPRVAFAFEIADGYIVGIDLVSDPEHLARLDLEVLDD